MTFFGLSRSHCRTLDPLWTDIFAAQDGGAAAAERVARRLSWYPKGWPLESIRLKARIEGIPPEEPRINAPIQGVIQALGREKEGEAPIHVGPLSTWLYDGQ